MTGLDRTGGHIHSLARPECLALLATTTVGRIAFVDDLGDPQIIPVNFALIDESIYFRTLPDGFLSRLRTHSHTVAFEVDHHDDLYRDGWNVTGLSGMSRTGRPSTWCSDTAASGRGPAGFAPWSCT